jgi:hypothetical protein
MKDTNMNEMDDVEDALQTWPVAQTPHGFSDRVLQRIEIAKTSRFKFRFTWLDYALALFTISGTFLAIFIWDTLPAPLTMRMTYLLFLLLNTPQYESVLLYSLFAIGGLLLFTLFTAILLLYPGLLNRKLLVRA